MLLKRIEKIIQKNVFEQKKKKPGLKYNPGLALINRPSNNWSQVLTQALTVHVSL